MVDSRRVGAKIANYRKQKNLTQIELANLVNVTPQAVSKWEQEILGFIQDHLDEYINKGRLVAVVPFLNDESITCILLNKSLNIEEIISIATLIPESLLINLLQNYNGYLSTSDLLTFSFLVDEETFNQIKEISKSK